MADPLSLLLSGGAGGLSIAQNPASGAGPVTFGAFTFAPKSSTLSPLTLAAIAAVGLVGLLALTRRRS